MLETKKVSKNEPKKVVIHFIVRERITFSVKKSSVDHSVSTEVSYITEEPTVEFF